MPRMITVPAIAIATIAPVDNAEPDDAVGLELAVDCAGPGLVGPGVGIGSVTLSVGEAAKTSLP